MPRIPRTEQTVAFQPAMMPGTSGDAYAAPGRAMQGLGNAIASLGASLDAKAEQENDYGDKLRMLKWSNETDLEELKRRSNYTGDGTNYTADTQNWYKEREASLYEGMSPKGRQKAALFIEGKRGTVVEGAQRFETEKRNQTMFSSAEATITSEFGRLTELTPEQFEAGSTVTLKGINDIINQNPLGEPAKERLREHARQLYEAAIIKVLPEGSRAQAAKRLMEQWQKTVPQEPVKTPGPQSSLSGNIGSVSAKYESGGRGVGFVSTGHKDPGGPSYGIHQLSSKDSMPAFLRSPEGQKYAAEFKGRSAGSAEFNAIYKKVAAADPQGFADAQYGYYSRTHFKPVLEHARALGYDVEDRGVQEALFSISVQHGGAKKIVSGAKAAAVGKDPAAQVVALFERRADYVGGVALPAETKASVLNRYRSEVKDALKYAGQKVTAGGGEVKVASLGGTVPAGAEPEQPAPSKITEVLKGTPEEKAAKLRELMSKGYQDVVHQLDGDGNDVIIAKKSQKPVWQRGRRGTNEDGTIPNELDRPDFAGPGWANGVVEDVKAGKLRPANTIPGETKVAEAPAMPATRYRPSVETKLMESLQKKLPALRAQDIAAVGKLVERAEKVSNEGVILPEAERKAVEAAVLATGSKELADRYTLANMAAAETYMMKGARPDRIKDHAAQMRIEIAKAGGEATPEQLAKVKAVEALAKHVDTKLDTDMLGWGQEIGILPQLPALDPGKPDPEALKAHAEAATYMAARYGRQPQVFSKTQAEAAAERFKAGGPQMLDMLGRYATGLGPQMMTVAMKQIAPHAPEGAIAGYLYGNNINQAAARDIAETMHRRKDPNYKGLDVRRAVSEPTAEAVLGDAFRTFPPEQRDAILKAADAIYENRVKGGKAAGYQAKDYEKAVRDVIGERTDAKGNIYGGSVPQDKTLGMFGKKNFVMIPPTWRQDTLKTTLETVSAEDLKASGLPMPVTKGGAPVSAVRLANRGKLVPVGAGLGTYAVAMGDPETPGKEDYLMAAPANPREDRQTLPNQPFVIDLNKLEPVLRKRLPSAFWSD